MTYFVFSFFLFTIFSCVKVRWKPWERGHITYTFTSDGGPFAWGASDCSGRDVLGEGRMWHATDSLRSSCRAGKTCMEEQAAKPQRRKEEPPRDEKELVHFMKSSTKLNLQARATCLPKVLADSGSCHKHFLPYYREELKGKALRGGKSKKPPADIKIFNHENTVSSACQITL